MITVTISINGIAIYTRTATRVEEPDANQKATYKLDDKSIIRHDPDDGAVKLAKKMLDTIHEVGAER